MSTLSTATRGLLQGRHYAALATLNKDGSMHLTPVWYLFENERLFVETASASHKARNIRARPQASLMIDIRQLGAERWVCGSGGARLIGGDQARELNLKIRRRYLTQAGLEDPRVGPVFAAADDVSIELTPTAWRAWDLGSIDHQFFGGLLGKTPEKWFLPLD